TCRSLAEETTDTILAHLQRARSGDTRQRPLPGGEGFPTSSEALDHHCRQLAETHGFDERQVHAVWHLWGTDAEAILAECALRHEDRLSLPDVHLPVGAARWSIKNEWPRTLDDLLERRLMLMYDAGLSRA